MKTTRALCYLITTTFFAFRLHAYEIPVHRQITETAFPRLTVDFGAHLGVTSGHRINGKPLQELMAIGAEKEDDLPRSLNHFFDPTHGVPLTTKLPYGFCSQNGATAVFWGLGTSPNAYSLYQGRNYYRESLIGPTEGAREVNLGRLFLSLGHLVHLVQDMAQPEHTRNDQHLSASNFLLGNGTKASVWEVWGRDNLVTTKDPITNQFTPPVVSYDGYPAVVLPDYTSYFHDAGGRGMADFSNLNFVTQDTNYSDEDLPGRCFYHPDSPRILNAARRVEKDVSYGLLDQNQQPFTITVDEEIYTSFPYDGYTGLQEQDPFHTYFSALDLETRKLGVPTYSLGDGSFLSRASMLIPRAVGYSVGIVNHFFRGNVGASWKEIGSGVYDMTITNRSSETIGPDARIEAVFRADVFYFGNNGSGYDTGRIVDEELADLVPGFAGLAPGESVIIHGLQPFGLKPGDELTKFERRIAITATLGNTPEEVIGLVQPPDAGKKLRVEITWAGATEPMSIFMEDGQEFLGCFRPGGCDRCAFPDQSLANACVADATTDTPVTYTYDPYPANKSLRFYLGATVTPSSYTMTAKFYLNGILVKTQTAFVRTSLTESPVFAQYP